MFLNYKETDLIARGNLENMSYLIRPTFSCALLASLIRLAWVGFVRPKPYSDFEVYETVGRNLSRAFFGNPGTDFSLGYPAFLSGFYSLGLDNGAVLITQVLLSGLVVGLVTWLLERSHGPSAAWLGGGILAIAPSQILFTSLLASETLFTFLIICAFVLLTISVNRALANDRRFTWTLLGAGFLFGLSASVRSVGLYLPFVLAIYLLWISIKRGLPLRIPVLLIAAATGALLLYASYNWKTRGTFKIAPGHGAYAVWQGTLPETKGSYIEGKFLPEAEKQTDPKKRDRAYLSGAIDNIIRAPHTYLWLMARKLWLSFKIPIYALFYNFPPDAKSALSPLNYYLFVGYLSIYQASLWILVAIAGWTALSRPKFWLWTASLLVILQFSAVFAATIGDNRFQVPVIPFLCLFIGSSPLTKKPYK